MGLDRKGPGNPAFCKGNKLSQNRPKEPKKIQVKRRLLGKWKTHPVDKLVSIANFIQATNPEFSGKIWMRLLDSCELEENKKKSSMPPSFTPDEKHMSEEESLKLLEEMEKNDASTSKDDTTSVATGSSEVQAQTSPEEDLRSNQS